MARELFAGVMSGTSLDGIDAVVADFAPASGVACETLGAAHVGLPTMLRDELLALQSPGANELARAGAAAKDRKSTRLNSSHVSFSYAVFCLKKKSARISDPGFPTGAGKASIRRS